MLVDVSSDDRAGRGEVTAEKTRPREEEVNVHLRCPTPGSSRAAPTRPSTSAAQALDVSCVSLGHTSSFRCRRHPHINLLAVTCWSKQLHGNHPTNVIAISLRRRFGDSDLASCSQAADLLLAACCLHAHPITVSRRTQNPS